MVRPATSPAPPPIGSTDFHEDTRDGVAAPENRTPLRGDWRSLCASGEFPFPAKTPVRAKPDGLTPVALRTKRPLIAPSRPSSSRLLDSRVDLWHVADVPGVQERGALRPGERRTERAGPKGQTFHGHGEQNARQARDWQATVRKSIAAAFYRVVTCRGCRENFSLPGRGAAPHTFQSANFLCALCGPLCSLW